MKKCSCCGADSVAEAHTCANCGEGSWSVPIVKSEPIEKPAEPKGAFVEHSFDSMDPETAVEVPARRRRNR